MRKPYSYLLAAVVMIICTSSLSAQERVSTKPDRPALRQTVATFSDPGTPRVPYQPDYPCDNLDCSAEGSFGDSGSSECTRQSCRHCVWVEAFRKDMCGRLEVPGGCYCNDDTNCGTRGSCKLS